jgi:serine/threonine-protein kinase
MATILIVDDEPDILVVVEAVLRSAGHEVMSFSEPQAVLEAARRHAVDAMILDVMMPGCSGFDLLGQLRREPSLAEVPILFLSALDSASERIRGLREGADDYLGKPFAPEELTLRLERLLRRGSGPSSRFSAADSAAGAADAAGGSGAPSGAPDEVAAEPAWPFSAASTEVEDEMPEALGRYQVLNLLGEGSMGAVYRGWDPKLQRMVALKTLKPRMDVPRMSHQDLVDRLLHEAVMVARFNHPNIVAVFDVGDAPDTTFIAMEFVDGPTLHKHLKRVGRLNADEVASLGLQMARALGAAHARGVVHHDVKPGNVLLDGFGGAKVADFGLANWIYTLAHDSGHIFGTPGFLAPEALTGKGYDEASDLFALGAVLYLALTGVNAFIGHTVTETVRNTLRGDVEAPSTLNPQVPEALEALVMRLLERDREHRFRNAGELTEALEEAGARAVPVGLGSTRSSGGSTRPESTAHSVILRTVTREMVGEA